MKAQSHTPAEDPARKRVLIVGGGYAGTTCAVSFARSLRGRTDAEVLLVEPDPCQQALSELDLVAVGPKRPQFCELWHPTVFGDLPVTVRYSSVTNIDPDTQTATLAEGDTVSYWRCVIATGAIPFVPDVPGLADYAVTMWSVDDAQELQQKIENSFRKAARLEDETERRNTLSFAVIGGGATGVEIVGTMAQLLPKRMLEHGLAPKDLSVTLIEGRDQILFDLPEKQRTKAISRLENMGATVRTNAMVEWVDDGEIRLASDETVPASVVVWCGGAKADPNAGSWGFETDNAGRLIGDENLLVTGRSDIYVIGDVASIRHPDDGRVLPMLAQMAIQEGPHVAKSLLGELDGKKPGPFKPHMRGEFVSVGPRWGVGWMYSFNLTGLPAIVMKRITYVKYWLQVGGVSLAWKRTREMLAMQR